MALPFMVAVHGARSRAPVLVSAGLSTYVQLPPTCLTAGRWWPNKWIPKHA